MLFKKTAAIFLHSMNGKARILAVQCENPSFGLGNRGDAGPANSGPIHETRTELGLHDAGGDVPQSFRTRYGLLSCVA